MEIKQLKIITILSIVLVIVLAIVSYYGAFVPSTYERDAASMAAQGIGQDIFDLFFVVPLLVIMLVLMHRNNKISFFIYSGIVFYILYSFFIYSFGVHFNNLFLLYCLTLSVSLYTFILVINESIRMDVQNWFNNKVPVRAVGIYFIIIALMFYLLWFKSIIPAILDNSIPKDVSDYDLLVNPVHVLDIAFVLPGLIITAILLMGKHRVGFILTPVFLVFIILLAIALIAMVIMLNIKGISEDISITGIFIILAVISIIFLYIFLKNIKAVKN